MEFKLDCKEIKNNLEKLPNRFNAALLIYGTTAAQMMQSEAQRNRPWTDRTSRARLGLTGSSELAPDELRIVLSHTVDYGVWLELAHEKKYAIVEPTIRLNATQVVSGLNNFLDKVNMR